MSPDTANHKHETEALSLSTLAKRKPQKTTQRPDNIYKYIYIFVKDLMCYFYTLNKMSGVGFLPSLFACFGNVSFE